MAEARAKEAWGRTSALMALLANCHRDPKKSRPSRPADFDPFARRKRVPKVNVSILKEIFIDGRMPSEELRKEGAG
ncbi:MAG: hypothetical protein AB1716_01005 [Planctomycetota bacterium]